MKYGERALEQLLAAAIWYDGVAPGTGERFLAQVDQLVLQIEMFPEAGVLVRPGVRQRLVPHFPYVVLYAADSAESVVVAVAHTSRREGYRLSRWEVRELRPAYLPVAA